jgi:protein YIPF6
VSFSLNVSTNLKQTNDAAVAGETNYLLNTPPAVLILFCRLLSFSAPDDQKALVFAGVFVLVSIGAAVVTLNAQLLGGSM